MDSARYKTRPQIESEAQSTGGKFFFLVLVCCMAAAVIMLTIKLGMVLFG